MKALIKLTSLLVIDGPGGAKRSVREFTTLASCAKKCRSLEHHPSAENLYLRRLSACRDLSFGTCFLWLLFSTMRWLLLVACITVSHLLYPVLMLNPQLLTYASHGCFLVPCVGTAWQNTGCMYMYVCGPFAGRSSSFDSRCYSALRTRCSLALG